MDKKEVLRKKIITRFIEAVEEISMESGKEFLTIRNISQRAGYKSSTLYNYFKGNDHLFFFVAMKNIRDYTEELQEEIKKSQDPLERLKIVLRCFSHHAFERPEIYSTIFLSHLEGGYEDYIQEYYDVFPEDLLRGEEKISTLLLKSSPSQRGISPLEPCIQQGYFKREDSKRLNTMIMLLFEATLARLLRGQVDKEEAKNQIIDYTDNLIEHFLIKK